MNGTVYSLDDRHHIGWDKTLDPLDSIHDIPEHGSITIVGMLLSGYSYIGCWTASRTPQTVMAKIGSEEPITVASTDLLIDTEIEEHLHYTRPLEAPNETLLKALKEELREASFLEEDTEEDIVIRLAPVRKYRVKLKIRNVRKGNPKIIYEEELEKEEL